MCLVCVIHSVLTYSCSLWRLGLTKTLSKANWMSVEMQSKLPMYLSEYSVDVSRFSHKLGVRYTLDARKLSSSVQRDRAVFPHEDPSGRIVKEPILTGSLMMHEQWRAMNACSNHLVHIAVSLIYLLFVLPFWHAALWDLPIHLSASGSEYHSEMYHMREINTAVAALLPVLLIKQKLSIW